MPPENDISAVRAEDRLKRDLVCRKGPIVLHAGGNNCPAGQIAHENIRKSIGVTFGKIIVEAAEDDITSISADQSGKRRGQRRSCSSKQTRLPLGNKLGCSRI